MRKLILLTVAMLSLAQAAFAAYEYGPMPYQLVITKEGEGCIAQCTAKKYYFIPDNYKQPRIGINLIGGSGSGMMLHINTMQTKVGRVGCDDTYQFGESLGVGAISLPVTIKLDNKRELSGLAKVQADNTKEWKASDAHSAGGFWQFIGKLDIFIYFHSIHEKKGAAPGGCDPAHEARIADVLMNGNIKEIILGDKPRLKVPFGDLHTRATIRSMLLDITERTGATEVYFPLGVPQDIVRTQNVIDTRE